MTIIPRFAATHHHHGHSSHGIHHRMRHPGPIMMYQSHQPSRAELHQHSHHHHHHAPHPHHHHSTTLQQQQQQQQTHPSNYPPPPTSLHFHSHYPHQSNHNTPHNSLAHPPFSALHDPLPPPLPAPPILQKPPLKEKTPMCLINELVRFNKIKYQYRLTDESGPSHKKNFTVLLKLGTENSCVYEEYIASGPSIKKAQHAAAALALEETKLKHPVPKVKTVSNGILMPTVELNTLAMKRREQIQYELIHPYHDPKCQRKDMRRNGKKVTKVGDQIPSSKDGPNDKGYVVNLKVGERLFKGEGVTLKAAKHDAAYAALLTLKHAPTSFSKVELDPSSAPFIPGNPLNSCRTSSEHKSPVSLVHENALKRNLSVTFQVERESGPPHMKTFITRCSMGEFSTEGHGEAKRASKKRSAELMLEKLKTLPPLANCSVSKRTSNNSKSHKKKILSSAKRRAKSLVKLQKSESDDSPSTVHPISRLIQIQHAKKEKEPIYTLLEERGRKRKLEFIMQVKVGDLTAVGHGSNKKLAKRAAAENMLEFMGVSLLSKEEGSSLKLNSLTKEKMENGSDECKQEMSVKSVGSSKKSVPGILYLDTTNSKVNGEDETSSKNSYKSTKSDSVSRSNTKVLVNNKTAINSNNNNNSNNNSKSNSNNNIIIKKNLNNANHDLDFLEDAGEAKVKLQKLSEIFKFSVSYSDFQKRGKNSSSSSSEYLTLVSLSMKPAQVSHGSGATPQESQEDAAKSALKFLSENGIEVSSSPSSNENGCTNINNNCS